MKTRNKGRRAAFLLSGLVAALVVVATAAAANNPVTTVRATSAYEFTPVHSGQYLAWTQRPTAASPASSNRVMAKVDGGPAFSVSSNQSYTGGISGDILVYQSVVNGQSDIRFYNLATRQNVAAPAEVNTSNAEFHPSMLGSTVNGWLLFGRRSSTTTQIILFNMANHHSAVLASGDVDPGQVNGLDANGMAYADWKKCATASDCRVNGYQFDPSNFTAGTTKVFPNAVENHTRSGPGVSANGELTFVEGRVACGADADIEKVDFATGTFTRVVSFNAGVDSLHTSVDGSTIYFDRHPCGGDSNLYKTSLITP